MKITASRHDVLESYRKRFKAGLAEEPESSGDEGRQVRVCVYCCLVKNNDTVESSFMILKKRYDQMAQDHPGWEIKQYFVDEKWGERPRSSFDEMIEACHRGEYDLIVTRSISTFAKTLPESLSIIKDLKGRTPPIGVYFLQDNFNSLAPDSELFLKLLTVIAEEESRQKSRAMRMGIAMPAETQQDR